MKIRTLTSFTAEKKRLLYFYSDIFNVRKCTIVLLVLNHQRVEEIKSGDKVPEAHL